MKPTSFWYWFLPSTSKRGTMARTRYRMTEEQAKAHPGAVKDERVGSLEVRDLPESSDEFHYTGIRRGRE